MDKLKDIRSIVKIDVLQNIQDEIASATGIAAISVDYRGYPITHMSGFSDFCKRMRSNEVFCKRCFNCDAHGGLNATITGRPYFYYCHCALVDFAVPLFLNGSFVGAVLCGQVKMTPEDEAVAGLEKISRYTNEWRADPAAVAEYETIKVVSFSKIKSIANLAQRMLQYMISEEYKNVVSVELNRKQKELDEEKSRRLSLEEAFKMRHVLDFQNKYGLDFIFYILNVIAKLAYKESATETENTVCDFSDIMRYLTDNSHNRFVTLDKELKYLNCFAAIQSRRLGGNFICEVSVPAKYFNIRCPFMLFHAVLENMLRYDMSEGDAQKIAVVGREENGAFILEITGRGVSFVDEPMKLALSHNDMDDVESGSAVLSMLNRRIKSFFGDSYGIFIRKNVNIGGSLYVRLPLSCGSVAK